MVSAKFLKRCGLIRIYLTSGNLNSYISLPASFHTPEGYDEFNKIYDVITKLNTVRFSSEEDGVLMFSLIGKTGSSREFNALVGLFEDFRKKLLSQL